MNRRGFALGVILLACNQDPPPPPPPLKCCAPSPKPECCMALGGSVAADSNCPNLTCEIPNPEGPGWTLVRDANSCFVWTLPSGPSACGPPPPPPPPEAGVPCAPVSVASYSALPMTPPNPAASACTSNELGDFFDACITSGLASGACSAFEASAGSCTTCLVSKASDAMWGPVVVSADHVKLNVAGCVAVAQGDGTASSCAQKISDEQGCEAFACDAVCPVTSNGGAAAYVTCVQQAAATDCRPYLDAECDWDDAGVTMCEGKPSKSSFVALAAVFCGG